MSMEFTARPLTPKQREFLADFFQCGTGDREWVRPMDIGGRDGTHHSAVLAQLERHGLVESRTRSPGVRGSKLYRLTPEDRAHGAHLTAPQDVNR